MSCGSARAVPVVDGDHDDLGRPLEEGQRVPDRPARLTGVLPAHCDTLGVEVVDLGRHHQDRLPETHDEVPRVDREQHGPGLGLAPDHDKVGGGGLRDEEGQRELDVGAPLDAAAIAGRLLEGGVRLPEVIQHGLVRGGQRVGARRRRSHRRHGVGRRFGRHADQAGAELVGEVAGQAHAVARLRRQVHRHHDAGKGHGRSPAGRQRRGWECLMGMVRDHTHPAGLSPA
jgi:hypothetical protein